MCAPKLSENTKPKIIRSLITWFISGGKGGEDIELSFRKLSFKTRSMPNSMEVMYILQMAGCNKFDWDV